MNNPELQQTPYIDQHSSLAIPEFAAIEFADNPEPRLSCLLLLDTSGSMAGRRITELNTGLMTFKDELAADRLASKRVEIGIVTFGNFPFLLQHFVTVDEFEPPTLEASGLTAIGSSIEYGINLINDRKQAYRDNGISYYRPWIFLITDGEPSDMWHEAAQQIHEGESRGSFSFYGVGVQDANMSVLQKICPPNRPPAALDGLRFKDLFSWLSQSMKIVSQNTPKSIVTLANPNWTSTSV